MECDCLVDSVCTATSTNCQDWMTYIDILFPDLSLFISSGVPHAVLAVVGFAVYMFAHGMFSLWSGVCFFVGAVRGIHKAVTWSSKLWRSFAASLQYARQCFESVLALNRNPTRAKTGHSSSRTSSASSPLGRTTGPPLSMSVSLNEPGLRLLLLGPSGAGRSQLADALLGCSEDRASCSSSLGTLTTESVQRRALVDGREVMVVDTPDLLGECGDDWKAREALRSLQLSSPGPHAVLLVIRVPGAAGCVDQDAALAVRVTLALFGAGVEGHVFTVFTHADSLAPGQTLATLLGADAGGLRSALSLCGLRAELVDNSVHCPPEDRRRMCMRLLERLEEMRALSGHFIHELQAREESMKEELLADMSSELAGKLGSM